jgi:hypothetical protein
MSSPDNSTRYPYSKASCTFVPGWFVGIPGN